MTEDKGKLDQLKGEAKDRIGGATGDKEKQAEGLKDKATGKAKEFAADVKDKAEELKRQMG
ncbi:hypothetical protein MFLO_01295 [Listeria floridensis FSL S10-1187]|uniref:CsbD-like domain-containing protein n=1 Tax=Listeria floridensis FSL S10-1187 TaxID=1265817 RepID=A0ABN0RIM3_9LIST|nr:CsbD family protein [Listeria floridensis]EUJ33821.1 hypothetical protein MFLO_01295 [Listeria floridensis FSL S10-1187]